MRTILFFGEFNLAKPNLKSWHRQRTDSELLGWIPETDQFDGDAECPERRVSEFLEDIESLEEAGGASFFSLEILDPELEGLPGDADDPLLFGRVMGVLQGDEVLHRWHQQIATAFGVMFAEFIADGEVFFLSLDENVAWEVSSNLGEELDFLTGKTLEPVFEDYAAEIDFLTSWVDMKEQHPEVSWEAYREQEENLSLGPLEQSPSQQAVMEALDDISASTLWKVACKHGIMTTDNAGPLFEVFEDAEELQEAIKERNKYLRVSGIVLLAAEDPDSALPLIKELLKDDSPHVRAAANEALGFYSTEEALDLLMAHPDEVPRVNLSRMTALQRGGFPALAGRLLEILESDPAFKAGTYPQAAPAAPERFDEEEATLDRAFQRSSHYLMLMSVCEDDSLTKKLIDLFKYPPVPPMRAALAEVLRQIGGPLVEEIQEELESYWSGTGLALNMDDERRREILGVSEDGYSSEGVVPFGPLGLEPIVDLVTEGFLHPLTACGGSPSVGEVLVFMEEWPEAVVYGDAFSPSRKDYKVQIHTLECPLGGLDDHRKKELREVFQAFCDGAQTLELEGAQLKASWRDR